MRSRLQLILTAGVLCAAVSSCASRVETRRSFPDASDLQITAEPAYPVEALEPGAAGEAAEAAWWNEVLLWGREHHDRLARVCNWANDLGMKLPKGYCNPS